MRLASQSTVILRNMQDGTWAPFYISELGEYEGQYIVYGTTQKHGGRNWKGQLYEVREKPGCFAVLLHETENNVLKLVRALGGMPNALQIGKDMVYVLNMGRLKGFWNGDHYNKDGMIKHARKMIDLWLEWKRLGRLPQWFLDLRAKAKSGNGHNRLWTP